MGKCSGLKGGGHHRRAVDVAEKKKNEKAARKNEHAEAGKRAVILKKMLTEIDPNIDLYLDAVICDRSGCGNGNGNGSSQIKQEQLPELCRAHFRNEACSNKRCKFSHDLSISEALANVVSGCNNTSNDENEGPPTIPALRHLPGILGEHNAMTGKKKQRTGRILLRATEGDAETSNSQREWSHLENALSEGSSAIDTIVSCLDSDTDVVHLGTTCRHLYNLVLEGPNGSGCKSVQLRKYRAKERKLERRNATLLSNRALSGGLRYAVGYFENLPSNNNSGGGKKGKGKNRRKNQQGSSKNSNKSSLRPVLVFDYENPHVFKAFEESGICNNKNNLSAALARECTIKVG